MMLKHSRLLAVLVLVLLDFQVFANVLKLQHADVCQGATNPASPQQPEKCSVIPCNIASTHLTLTTLIPPFLLSVPKVTHPMTLRLYSSTETPCGVVTLDRQNKTLSLQGSTCDNLDDTTDNHIRVPSSDEEHYIHVKVMTEGHQVTLNLIHYNGDETHALDFITAEGCDISYITVKPHYSNKYPYGFSHPDTPAGSLQSSALAWSSHSNTDTRFSDSNPCKYKNNNNNNNNNNTRIAVIAVCWLLSLIIGVSLGIIVQARHPKVMKTLCKKFSHLSGKSDAHTGAKDEGLACKAEQENLNS